MDKDFGSKDRIEISQSGKSSIERLDLKITGEYQVISVFRDVLNKGVTSPKITVEDFETATGSRLTLR